MAAYLERGAHVALAGWDRVEDERRWHFQATLTKFVMVRISVVVLPSNTKCPGLCCFMKRTRCCLSSSVGDLSPLDESAPRVVIFTECPDSDGSTASFSIDKRVHSLSL